MEAAFAVPMKSYKSKSSTQLQNIQWLQNTSHPWSQQIVNLSTV